MKFSNGLIWWFFFFPRLASSHFQMERFSGHPSKRKRKIWWLVLMPNFPIYGRAASLSLDNSGFSPSCLWLLLLVAMREGNMASEYAAMYFSGLWLGAESRGWIAWWEGGGGHEVLAMSGPKHMQEWCVCGSGSVQNYFVITN